MMTYAIKTWKCIAFPALLFMILAVLLLENALQSACLMREDIGKNGRVTCMLRDHSSEEVVLGFSETDNGSFVYETEARVQCQSMEKTFGVTGIDEKMLIGTIICGTCYTDGNGSLSLVVNQALISELIDKETVAMDDLVKWLDQSVVMEENVAKIYGVIEDGLEMPMVYISVAAAENFLKQQGDISYTKSYCIIAPNLKSMESIQEEMSKNGIETSIDGQKVFDWKLKLVQIKDQIIMGLIALLGFISNIMLTAKTKLQQEEYSRKGVMFVRIMVNVCVGTIGGLLLHGFIWLWVV